MIKALFFAAVCLFSLTAHADEFRAAVVAVHDGDTVTVVTEAGQRLHIRLADIDAPELDQPFGPQARQTLDALVYGKAVIIDDRGVDRYGRTIGVIYLNGLDANEQMVRDGLAWDYVRYDTDPLIPALQQQAQAGRLGLWSDQNAIAPWVWRHPHSSKIRF